MGKLAWYLNRLLAMSPREVMWRVSQKRLQRQETAMFATHAKVTTPLYQGVEETVAEVMRRPGDMGYPLGLGESVSPVCLGATAASADGDDGEAVRLLGGFPYGDYATDWHAGFNTPVRWPLQPSYSLSYKQRDDIGDARVNWELNRHRQFVRLAIKGDFRRLEALVDDWADKNPFLWGISWTSPMEVAIRSISWMTAARVVAASAVADDAVTSESDTRRLMAKLLTGAANMTVYLTRHESGFSSANNHLIVEVAAVALAGMLFGKEEWTTPSLDVLDRELQRQVSSDGVDLESSLHYHGFVMEAYLIVWREMASRGMEISQVWRERLEGMARFVASSRVAQGVWCVFGDDDEARILDSGRGDRCYFEYLLDLYAGVSGTDVREIQRSGIRETYAEGGYSFLRLGGMFAGIDHAPLGFGSIAAHAHNDILSFQLFLDGMPVLVDSGTYLYHTDLPRRDQLRSTRMHNTVTIDGKEQSQMLGAFLWGKKATSRLLSVSDDGLTATVKGLSGVTHTRDWQMTRCGGKPTLQVTDGFDRPCHWEATFIVAPRLEVVRSGYNRLEIGGMLALESSGGDITIENVVIAPEYGRLISTVAIRIIGKSRGNVVTLQSL